MSLEGHILIVDDLETNREALARLLEREGLSSETACEGNEAVQKANSGLFDTILLDVMMPGMDGIETLGVLKQDPGTRDIPVLMVSALDQGQAVRHCIEMGADDYLTKPIDRLMLRSRLSACLRRKHLQDRERDFITRLQASNEELRRVNLLKSRLLAIAAHDLKNPLTTLMLLVDQLGDLGESPAQPSIQRKATQRIRGSVEKMLGILQALLDSAAMEAGHLILHKHPVDLLELTRTIVEENLSYAESKHIELMHQVDTPGDWMVEADDIRIREALDNLVNNAIKFSPFQSRVELIMQREGAWIRVRVKDQGPGLTEEDRNHAFGMYQRLSAQPTGGESSTGLGLSIVKQMVELHGGHIEIESEPGQGASFLVDLPGIRVF
ncbi:hybrid sensor histidine kinase/response regulator [Holophaga foetida]|uniref:hybrid sensor histidine kinase/response regulator n=1 Tax=Holophaga foetida TaxID=35839 RepID=UPI0002472AA4|nr:hybrid sensor histidine kinase/response regulator [Holophaga foetida]